MLSPHEVFYGNRLPKRLLLFFQSTYHRVPQQRKTDPRARPCFLPTFGYNNGRDCFQMLDATTAMVVYSRDVTLYQTREPVIPPARTSKTGTSNSAPTPEHLLIPPPAGAPLPAPPAAPLPLTTNPTPTCDYFPTITCTFICSCICTRRCTFARARAYRYTCAVDALSDTKS